MHVYISKTVLLYRKGPQIIFHKGLIDQFFCLAIIFTYDSRPVEKNPVKAVNSKALDDAGRW